LGSVATTVPLGLVDKTRVVLATTRPSFVSVWLAVALGWPMTSGIEVTAVDLARKKYARPPAPAAG